MKRQIDEIVISLGYKISEKEIKLMEEYMIGKLEDQRINFGKKFADKIDIQKSIRNLDIQIKFIFDLISKKDKSDNWLLAKKPLSSYQCASCDSYINDIAASNQNQQPNYKNPVKDSSDNSKVIIHNINYN